MKQALVYVVLDDFVQNCRHRQVHCCRKTDVKQALVYVVLDDFVQNCTYDIIYA